MKKLLFVTLFLVTIVIVGAIAYVGYLAQFGFHTRSTGSALGVVRYPEPSSLQGEVLRALPESDSYRVVDLRADDVTALDLGNVQTQLLFTHFDSNTKWPTDLPSWFSPQQVLDWGKNPGLGLRRLHEQGITGRGVGVGIVDQTLLVDHVEYADRLALYEEIHNFEGRAQMHGPMVASILAGETTGVAPEAELYYIASSNWRMSMTGAKSDDYTWTAKAIDRLLEVNESLPPEKKIRVISISKDWSDLASGYAEVIAAVERASEAGVMVVSVGMAKYSPYHYGGLGRDPLADPDQLASYEMSLFVPNQFTPAPNQLFVPIDSRTYASDTGQTAYTFDRQGGYSQGAPYVAGLYALACQVNPQVTPEQFWERALETANVIAVKVGDRVEEVRVANPVALMASWAEVTR